MKRENEANEEIKVVYAPRYCTTRDSGSLIKSLGDRHANINSISGG
jgi:hypothetical protein